MLSGYKASDYAYGQGFILDPARISAGLIERPIAQMSAVQAAVKLTYGIDLPDPARFASSALAGFKAQSDFTVSALTNPSLGFHAPSQILDPASPALLGAISVLGNNIGLPQPDLNLNSAIGLFDPACGSYAFAVGFNDYELPVIRRVIQRTKIQIHRLFIAGVERILGNPLKVLQEAQKKRARLALRERILHRSKVKLFNRPLLLVRHSLHPNVSIAL